MVTPSKNQSSNSDKTFAFGLKYIFFIVVIACNLLRRYFRLQQWKHWNPPSFHSENGNYLLIQGNFYESKLVPFERQRAEHPIIGYEVKKWVSSKFSPLTWSLTLPCQCFPITRLLSSQPYCNNNWSSTVHGRLPWWSCLGPAWWKTWLKVYPVINLFEMKKTVIHQHKKLLLSGGVLVTQCFPCMLPGTCSSGTVLSWGKFFREVFFHNERLLHFGRLNPPIHVRQPLQQCWLG